MQDNRQKQTSPCSIKNMTVPEFITCTKCGDELELWTDEDETICQSCGHKVFRKEAIIH
jgi:rRNA maturation endonuclease Nob1